MKKKVMPKVSGEKGEKAGVVMSVEETTISKGLSRSEKIHIALFFAVVSFSTIVIDGLISIAVTVLFLIFSLRKKCLEVGRENLSIPMVGIFCMMALYGISAIYSPFGSVALLELFRGMSAFILAGYALLHFRKKHVPALLWGYVTVVTIYTFVSLDMAASRVIYDGVNAVSSLFGGGRSARIKKNKYRDIVPCLRVFCKEKGSAAGLQWGYEAATVDNFCPLCL